MMQKTKSTVLAGLVISKALAGAAMAEDVYLMDGVAPAESAEIVPAGTYKTDCGWKIGMSHFGVNANTWTVQVAHESEGAAEAHQCVDEFILLDAGFDQAKQVADIEDLIAQGVDAIIVQPVTTTSADASIKRAATAGIPVVLHTGRIETDAFTVEIQGGAEHFGKVMGDFLVEKLGGEGRIWVLRGLAGHPEDTNRYNGLLQALEGTNIEIVAEQHGDWVYDKGKSVCETLFLTDPNVDGVWSSGAGMTRACIDVFDQFGVSPIPPVTGEGLNGFFGQWIEQAENGFDSISAEYSPAQGAAGVRAAIALLEGQELYKSYDYNPAGWDLERVRQFYRDDLAATVWWPTELSEEKLQELYGLN